MSSTDNFVLIDGDIIVYRCGFSVAPDADWGICKARVDNMLQEILHHTNSGMAMGFLTDGKENYRHKIATIAPYKGNRPAIKPKFYDEIRDYLANEHNFEMQYTQEADDAIGISHAELTFWNPKEPVVIASIDKDLLMIPGHHYNIASRTTSYVTVEQGFKNFYKQVLTGDKTDNIIGLMGVGPVKAGKIIDPMPIHGVGALMAVNTVVYATYLDKGRTVHEFDENKQLLWIRRSNYPNPGSNADIYTTYLEYRRKENDV